MSDMQEIVRLNRIVGYQRCLLDLQEWLRSQAGKGDTNTLIALRHELMRLAVETPAKAQSEAA